MRKRLNLRQRKKHNPDPVENVIVNEDGEGERRLPSLNLSKDQKRVLYSVILLVVTFVLSLFVMGLADKEKFEKIDASFFLLEFVQDASAQTYASDVPEVPQLRDQENPVNGVLVTRDELDEMQSRKLVVVSLNNHSDARPQFGLSKADYVFEVLAEGGITRYNAYYYQDQTIEKIGPIRSARSYMLENFLGFDDPVFVHEGQASYPSHETPVPSINTLRHLWEWNIESMQTAASRYRDPDRIRTAGYVHSLMTGFDLINPEIDRLGWRASSSIEPLKFKFDEPEETRGEISEIEIKFTSLSTNTYSAKFEFDPATNTYLRYIGGEKDMDALTGEQVAPKNVVVEYHNYRDAMDGHSRIIIDMTGEGEAFIFRDGKMIQGTWKKAAKEDRTKYFDGEEQEIEFNRGQIWVSNAIQVGSRKITDLYVDGNEI